MVLESGCRCGAARYEVSGKPEHVSLCHCRDCQRASGAPVVAWGAFNKNDFHVLFGNAKTRNSSGQSMRSFCADCVSSLWFVNEQYLPDIVDIQVATLDDPEALAPILQIQTAERIGWMKEAHKLPKFERFPGE